MFFIIISHTTFQKEVTSCKWAPNLLNDSTESGKAWIIPFVPPVYKHTLRLLQRVCMRHFQVYSSWSIWHYCLFVYMKDYIPFLSCSGVVECTLILLKKFTASWLFKYLVSVSAPWSRFLMSWNQLQEWSSFRNEPNL